MVQFLSIDSMIPLNIKIYQHLKMYYICTEMPSFMATWQKTIGIWEEEHSNKIMPSKERAASKLACEVFFKTCYLCGWESLL